ncbi:YtzH-like family protein [Neobacillus sp. LXY-4]|uniref:YtzH-like family protein n=1 Tax=Neobacillus sp. LXY-4 TaxID=3379826 RepID=UPI003EDF0A06
MPLNDQDQVNLLKDILSNQQTDCCGSVSEYEQLERLVKSLMVNTNVNHDVKTVLQEIYYYSQNGIQSKNINDHIDSNQQRLSNWVNEIDQLT